MALTIITVVVLLLLATLVGGVRFIYSLASHNGHTMQDTIKTKALDVFLYLGIGISLVTSVTNLLQVIFSAIDRKFVDLLSGSVYVDMTGSDVRFAIATLVVMFPIYIGLSWYVGKSIVKYHYKQDIPVRKVMIYCTLFVTILTLIGTLVSVIYTYLGGELSVRFGLKALSVFLVALALFSYYYYSLKRDYSKKTSVPMMITILASLAVVILVAWSISVIGTPSEMRARKIDNTRLSDISRLQQEILNRVQMTDKLPATLEELSNAFQSYKVPSDPVTKEAYGYTVIQQPTIKVNLATNKKEMVISAVFELCATFDTTRELDARGQPVATPVEKGGVMATDSFYSVSNYYYEGDQSPFWNHGVGRTCFKRIISSDMYYGR